MIKKISVIILALTVAAQGFALSLGSLQFNPFTTNTGETISVTNLAIPYSSITNPPAILSTNATGNGALVRSSDATVTNLTATGSTIVEGLNALGDSSFNAAAGTSLDFNSATIGSLTVGSLSTNTIMATGANTRLVTSVTIGGGLQYNGGVLNTNGAVTAAIATAQAAATNAAKTYTDNAVTAGTNAIYGAATNASATISTNIANARSQTATNTIDAASLTGTIDDARNSTNVARLNGTNGFTGTNTFSAPVILSAITSNSIIATQPNSSKLTNLVALDGNTSHFLNGAGAFTTPAGGGGGAIILSNSVFVAKNGNDSTGTSNRLDLPLLTINGAKTKSNPGDDIEVYAGEFNEINLTNLAPQWAINYNFHPGVIINTSNILDGGIVNDRGFPINITIGGEGSVTNFGNTLYHEIFELTNALSHVNARFKTITSSGDYNWIAVITNCADFFLTADDVNSQGDGYLWAGGDNVHINATRSTFLSGGFISDVSGSDPVNMYANGMSADASQAPVIKEQGTNVAAASWYSFSYLTQNGAAPLIQSTGDGKVYVTAQKLLNNDPDTPVVVNSGNGKQWIKADKLTSFGGGYISISSGTTDITVTQYEGDVSVGMANSGGTLYVHSGRVYISETGVTHTSGITVLDGVSITSTNSNCVVVSGDGLTLTGGQLFSSDANDTIATDGSPRTVNIGAPVYLNHPPSANVAFASVGQVRTSKLFPANLTGDTVIVSDSGGGLISSSVTTSDLSAAAIAGGYRAGTTNIANLASSQAVLFSTPMADTNYVVTFGFEGTLSGAAALSATAKTTNGFTANIIGVSTGATIDYVATRKQ